MNNIQNTLKQNKSPDNTKDALVEAGCHLFAKQGYAATSVKQIADRAGVNISLVSYHFGGKKGLYKACLEPFVEEKISFFERNILRPTSKEDFRFRLKLFLEEIIGNELKNPDTACIVRRDVEMDDPIIHEIFKKTIVKLFETFIGFIKSGQVAGYIRSDIDPKTISVLFMGGIQHALRTDQLRKKLFGVSISDPKHRDELIHTALEMFFNGLEKKDV